MSTNPLKRWWKDRIAIDADDWTPVAPDFDADYFAFRCDTSAVVYRSDKDDPDTEDTLPATVQDGVTGAAAGPHGRNWPNVNRSRFPAGEDAVFVKSVQPTATLVVTWVL